MKKIIVSVWLLAAVMLFASCNQKAEQAAPAETAEAANAFVGTTWMACHTQFDTLPDTLNIYTSDVVIKFLDAQNGVAFSNHRIFVNSAPALDADPVRTPFTYTLQDDGGKMVLDFGKEDTVHHFPRYVENTFQFDSQSHTLTTFASNNTQLERYFEVK